MAGVLLASHQNQLSTSQIRKIQKNFMQLLTGILKALRIKKRLLLQSLIAFKDDRQELY